jgi:hypothetical protein
LLVLGVLPARGYALDYSTVAITTGDRSKTVTDSDGDRLVWSGNFVEDGSVKHGIFYFDGAKTTRLPVDFDVFNRDAVIEGNRIAYISAAPESHDINLYDIQTGEVIRVTDADLYSHKQDLVIRNGKLAWVNTEDPGHTGHYIYSVWLYDIATREISQVSQDITQGGAAKIALGPSKLYWEQGQRDVHVYDSDTKAASIFLSLGYGVKDIVVDEVGENLAWTQYTDEHRDLADVYFSDGSTVKQITDDNYSNKGAYLYGSYLVWSGAGSVQHPAAWSYDVDSDTKSMVGLTRTLPRTDGTNVVYARPGDIYNNTYTSDPVVESLVTGDVSHMSFTTAVVDVDGMFMGETSVMWSGRYLTAQDGDIYTTYDQVYVAKEGGIPTTPSGLGATSPTNQPPHVVWDAVDGADAGYRVYRGGVVLGVAETSYFIDSGLSEGGSYSYTVSACNVLGCSAPSNEIIVVYDVDAPVISGFMWQQNPKAVSANSELIVSVDDMGGSGVRAGEYFIDADPGQGNGVAMQWDGASLSASIESNLSVGVYEVYVRAQDNAGNWGELASDYLVVYDPNGFSVTGRRTVVPSLLNGDVLPGLISGTQNDTANFAFTAGYNKGHISNNSKLRFSYSTGTDCKKATSVNCHNFELSSESITWLVTEGVNNSTAIFQGLATLEVDGVASTVLFRVAAVDGERLSATSADRLEIKVYNTGDDPNIDGPIYMFNAAEIERGNIKIS